MHQNPKCRFLANASTTIVTRFGFSIVELLVVVSIIVLLLALLLPAIQKVREVANKMKCHSNLRQLMIAAQHFHVDYHQLPPGYLGPSLENNANRSATYQEGQWIGHLPMLLPYFEQDSLFRSFHINFQITKVERYPWYRSSDGISPNIVHYSIASNKIPAFVCPSTSDYTLNVRNTEVPSSDRTGTILGFHVYNTALAGANTIGIREDYRQMNPVRFLAVTNYVGVAGCAGIGDGSLFGKYIGVYTNRKTISLAQVANSDGTSNTLMYGENSGSKWNDSRHESMNISWVGGGSLGTYRGLERAIDADITSFSSHHTTGVGFGFADGSVRTIKFANTSWSGVLGNFTSDWYLLQQLAGYRDGMATNTSALFE